MVDLDYLSVLSSASALARLCFSFPDAFDELFEDLEGLAPFGVPSLFVPSGIFFAFVKLSSIKEDLSRGMPFFSKSVLTTLPSSIAWQYDCRASTAFGCFKYKSMYSHNRFFIFTAVW